MAGADRRRGSPGLRAGVALAITVALFGLVAWIAPDGAYPWIKALHVVAIIAWMAGMLYLPRLFVNHAGVAVGSGESALLKGMEQRLLTIILNPAMAVAWVSGLWMAAVVFHFSGGWLHVKLALVLALSGVHGYLSAAVRRFAEDRNTVSERTWRILNEVPALLMIGIVIMVVVKPL